MKADREAVLGLAFGFVIVLAIAVSFIVEWMLK